MSMNRRDFLRLGPSGLLASSALTAHEAQAKIEPEGMKRLPAVGQRHDDGIVHPRSHPPTPERTVSSVCGVCFWKCGIRAEIGADGRLLHLRGNPEHPSSRGRLCPQIGRAHV